MATTPVAWVFPGQGSQMVGMGKDLADRYPSAARVFEEANEAIGVDLRTLCFDGPQDELDRTANTQPALVTTSIAALRAAEEAMGAPLPEPVVVLGHSLGEFSALVAGGALRLADALFFVRRTGPVELQRAVLLAAIATELKVKEILRSAPPKKAALVEIIIGRDAPVAVAALFDKTLSAAIGHSLLDEQKDLFKRVWRLFELRNQIAHSGAVPDLESARDLVRAAREASEWLDSIKPGNTASPLLDQSKSGDPS